MTPEIYMSLAYKEALKAEREEEVPVGAVVVYGKKVIAKAYNKKEQKQRVSAHAEMLALDEASRYLKNWRLEGCSIYVTLEPCFMCTGALISSRISRLIYACKDPKNKEGFLKPQKNFEILSGIMEKPCSDLIKSFFKLKRLKNH